MIKFPTSDLNWNLKTKSVYPYKQTLVYLCVETDLKTNIALNTNYILYGDDRRPIPQDLRFNGHINFDQATLLLDSYKTANLLYQRHHFPEATKIKLGKSKDYILILFLGSVDWVGIGENAYWHCTKKDFSNRGNKLYETVSGLYPEQKIYLLTFF